MREFVSVSLCVYVCVCVCFRYIIAVNIKKKDKNPSMQQTFVVLDVLGYVLEPKKKKKMPSDALLYHFIRRHVPRVWLYIQWIMTHNVYWPLITFCFAFLDNNNVQIIYSF